MAGLSPTQLSLKEMRKRGMVAEVVEKWVPMQTGGFRKDLFGVIDVVAIAENEIVFVQSTSASNLSSRRTKLRDSEHYEVLLACGARFELHGWKKVKGRWCLKQEHIC
jgi:hypothetical protein